MAGPLSVEDILAKQKADREAAAKVSPRAVAVSPFSTNSTTAQVPVQGRTRTPCSREARSRGQGSEAARGG